MDGTQRIFRAVKLLFVVVQSLSHIPFFVTPWIVTPRLLCPALSPEFAQIHVH